MTLDERKIVGLLVQGFSIGLTDRECCVYAKCSKDWLYDYIKRNPEFGDQKEALKDNPKIKAKSIINKSLDEEDKEVAKWYLERKVRDEFSSKQYVEQTTKTVPTTEEDCKKELQKIAEEQGISLEELMEREGLK